MITNIKYAVLYEHGAALLARFAPLVVALLLLVIAVRAATSPLRHLPGPIFARFSRLWYWRKVARGDFEKTNQELHKRYGKIVRITPNEYSISDVESLKTIYGHGTAFIKSPWYRASGNPDPRMHDLFTDQNPKRHAEGRRKVAQLYAMTNLMEYEPFVQTCVDEILKKFEHYAWTAETINMQHWLQCYAFDLIGLITLNKRFGFLDDGEDKGGLLAALHNYLRYAAKVGVYNEWHTLLSRLNSLLPSTGMAYLFSFTQEQLRERLAAASEKIQEHKEMRDFLTRLLHMHNEAPNNFTMKDVFTACITNIGAGSDTTSISLAAILYYLYQSPESLAKLRNEIAAMQPSSNPETSISFRETQAMPYLQACIKEALRLHPATGLPLGRVVPPEGAAVCGQFFPKGTVVGVNTWVIHRDRDIWGSDADKFRPERWLESSDKSKTMEKCYMPFGLGSRTCIGKNISLLEIAKLVPEVVKRFDIELVNTDEGLRTENVWFVKQKNFNCKLRMRNSH